MNFLREKNGETHFRVKMGTIKDPIAANPNEWWTQLIG